VVGTENGSVNLVDLKGRQIITSKKFSAAVNCVKFLEHENFLVIGLQEIGTRGKILVVGTENGSVNLVDLKGRQIITSKKFSAAVNCVKFLEHENFLVVGLQDGQILVLDVPNLTEISKIHDSDSSVESLLTLRNGFVVGKYDGACLWYGFDPVHNDISKDVIVLTGADVDPITAMAKDQDYIFTSCRDGCIRKYSIINMFH